MKYQVLFGVRAKKDILGLYDYIAEQSSPERAEKYLARIERWCEGLRTFPVRGVLCNDIRKGLRVAGFERRVSIGFQITGTAVIILRILYGGRDLLEIDFAAETELEIDPQSESES